MSSSTFSAIAIGVERCLRAVALHLVAAAVLVATASAARAQDTRDFQIWTAALATADFAPAAPTGSAWLDVHGRRGDPGAVSIVRPGLGLHFTSYASAWIGYAWIGTANDAASDLTHEHRIWQQLLLQHKTCFGVALQSRTRFEQRFHENGDDVGFRVRQFVRGNVPFGRGNILGAAVWDELFLGLVDTDWGARAGFDQNRLFLGLYLAASTWARLEMGYLHVFVERPGGDLRAHALATNLFIAFRPPTREAATEP
jgi:hypothetical protein